MRLVSARLKAHGAKRRGRLDIVYVLNVSGSSPIWGLNRRSNRQAEDAQEENQENRELGWLPLVDAFRTFFLQPSMQVKMLFADIKGLASYPHAAA
jgi:hypothetical protein